MTKFTRLALVAAISASFGTAAFALEHGSWSYGGNTGPHEWSQLSEKNKLCQSGLQQSPVSLKSKKAKKVKATDIKLEYRDSAAKMVNNGHTIEVDLPGDGNDIKIKGDSYELAQFHFHTPSEHELDGKHFPMELHMVNKDHDGNIAVIGVFIREGKENKALASLFSKLPGKGADGVAVRINPADLLPADHKGLFYTGSLTTPPCTENVHWLVLEEPIEMSAEQIQAFRKEFPDNHRPVQPFNGRKTVEEDNAL
ncbi:carbonic anhydrase family protein [Paraburkholderia bonniea]|uniref:carbonic anhydrase n=1 Tax=Paraburkholderia bonniea TaxID=2152891 RepID=UPI0015812F73|nr:carbonic anhydrase family protein [Paraburkholderia bonniea]WJF90516.1 carbonic anhydrase family protein [Paraburkholderia bonniea]WJF93831.1 carbonic anhydrase family protein [Paraburkholderia bonniea]